MNRHTIHWAGTVLHTGPVDDCDTCKPAPAPEPEVMWFAAWRCSCTDVQPTRAPLPERCPCHDRERLGVEPVTPGVSTNLGHLCPQETS